MKRTLLASVALFAITTTPATAAGNWYIAGGIGANWVQDTNPFTFYGDTLDTEFDTGWILTGSLGYRWAEGFRGELELGYRKNDVDSIFESPNGGFPFTHTNVSGEVTQFSLMANALYDIRLAEHCVLTVGGGIGIADDEFDASGSGSILIVDANDDWSFAYQAIAGAAYDVSPRTQIFIEYRYFVNDGHDVITYPPPNIPLIDEVDFENHSVSVGVRFAISNNAS